MKLWRLASSCSQLRKIGLPVLDRLRNNLDIYAEEAYAPADQYERFGDVVRTIVDRGVDEGVLPALTKEFKLRSSRFAEPFHLFRYLDERVFTYNQRCLGDYGRFEAVMHAAFGRRLTYVEVTGR